MEALCPKLDLNVPRISSIPCDCSTTKLGSSSDSNRFSCLISQRWKRSFVSSPFRFDRFRNFSHKRCPYGDYQVVEVKRDEMDRRSLIGSVGRSFFGFVAAVTAFISVFCDSPALAVAFPVSGAREVVVSCVDGSPAARAGIHEGDELIEIEGEKLDGFDGGAAAQRLRGRVGTTVTRLVYSVKLPREFIKLSPISFVVTPHRTPDGHLTKNGNVKLSAFSQTAPTEMESAIQEMEGQGVQSNILDLCNNQGGLVKAGLDGGEILMNTIDRDGTMLPINVANGHASAHDPLLVLINEGSASASEILAGALHDNGGAILIQHKTFEKGKIQDI